MTTRNFAQFDGDLVEIVALQGEDVYFVYPGDPDQKMWCAAAADFDTSTMDVVEESE